MHFKVKELISQIENEARANAHHHLELKKIEARVDELTNKQRYSFSQDRNAEIRSLKESKIDMEIMLSENLKKFESLTQDSMREIPKIITEYATERAEDSNVNFSLHNLGTRLGKQTAERMQ